MEKKVKEMVFTVLLLTILSPVQVFAAHPLVSDDTGTHGVGKYQLEVNSEAGFDRLYKDGVATKTSSQQVAAIISAGLGDRVDLVLGLPWQWTREKTDGALTRGGNGSGDLSLELKWRFFERDGFSLAVKPGVTLPSGDEVRGLGNGKISEGLTFIATQEMAPVIMHLNAAYLRNEFRQESDRQTNRCDLGRASLAFLVEVVKNLQLTAEFGLETNSDRTSPTWPAFFTAGAIYSLRDNLYIDLGIKRGLNDPATDLTLLAGLSLHF